MLISLWKKLLVQLWDNFVYEKSSQFEKIFYYPIFSIIVSSFSIFSDSSIISDSLLLDCNSTLPEGSLPQTRILVSSFPDCFNSIFCFSRNDRREISGSMISVLRELIYLSESKRSHLFARDSIFSSLITRLIISEKVDESESNPSDKILKFISFWKFS